MINLKKSYKYLLKYWNNHANLVYKNDDLGNKILLCFLQNFNCNFNIHPIVENGRFYKAMTKISPYNDDSIKYPKQREYLKEIIFGTFDSHKWPKVFNKAEELVTQNIVSNFTGYEITHVILGFLIWSERYKHPINYYIIKRIEKILIVLFKKLEGEVTDIKTETLWILSLINPLLVKNTQLFHNYLKLLQKHQYNDGSFINHENGTIVGKVHHTALVLLLLFTSKLVKKY